MKYFFDFEFNENVNPIEIISAGIVAEDNREWYAIHNNYSKHSEYLRVRSGDLDGCSSEAQGLLEDFPHLHSCNDWVKDNVLPILHIDWSQQKQGDSMVIGTEDDIKNSLMAFVGLDPAPQFWAYYGSYDWFLLTRMFKSFDKMPKKWPQICYDLYQYARHVGMHRNLPPKLQPAHNALIDARWTKLGFELVKEGRAAIKEPIWP
jgi:hypothetical protein